MPDYVVQAIPSSDLNFGHLGVARAIAATLHTHCEFRVLQELQAGGSWASILHLVDGLLDEAE